ncbi:MAG: hypothetical protein F4Y37_03300 [Caldilineaceae bacterium SB0664_bin_22]|nr:hypothetical protein [Caldilineaceae bacterium SB0664_bin_22]
MHVLCQLMASFSLSESHSWGGRADQVFVIEVKLNASVEAARDQLHAQGYARPYMEEDREVTTIYLNFKRGRNSEDPPTSSASLRDCIRRRAGLVRDEP